MVSDREFLLLSMISYINISELDKGRSIYDILAGSLTIKKVETNFKFLNKNNIDFFFEAFKEDFKRWKVYKVLNKRPASREINGSSKSKTGFFAIALKNDKNEIVISYRGSEIAPFEEAYKDFIENNILLGMGKRPIQFDNAANFYFQILKDIALEDRENLYLTGHSLGGGLAEYVAVISNKELGFIPKTVTISAVGIKKEGVIEIDDFVDVTKLLKEIGCTFSQLEILKPFIEHYYESLKSYSGEDLCNHLLGDKRLIIILIGSIEKIFLQKDKREEFKKKIKAALFTNSEIEENIKKGKIFIDNFYKNVEYVDRIKNYGHSKDATNEVYNHIGCALDLDRNLAQKEISPNSILKTILSKNKAMLTYHFEDVYLPFLDEEKLNTFTTTLNKDYIASELRSLIYKEIGLSKAFLNMYYNRVEIEEYSFQMVKKEIILALTTTKKEIIYRNQLIKRVEKMDYLEFIEIWNKVLDKIGAPFIKCDLFDAIVY